MVSRFVNTGKISWTRLIELMALKPAEIVGLEGGHLSIGMPADVVIIDAQTEKEVQPQLFKSKGRNCPFKGWKVAGWPVATFVNGARVF
jgi:dihydroorotase